MEESTQTVIDFVDAHKLSMFGEMTDKDYLGFLKSTHSHESFPILLFAPRNIWQRQSRL